MGDCAVLPQAVGTRGSDISIAQAAICIECTGWNSQAQQAASLGDEYSLKWSFVRLRDPAR